MGLSLIPVATPQHAWAQPWAVLVVTLQGLTTDRCVHTFECRHSAPPAAQAVLDRPSTKATALPDEVLVGKAQPRVTQAKTA